MDMRNENLLNEGETLQTEIMTTVFDESAQNTQNALSVLDNFNFFPERVYEDIPILVKQLKLTPNSHDSDISLLSLLTSIGSCLPNVYSYYGDKQYPNLYTFIVAPAASNKRNVEFGMPIVRAVHNYFDRRYRNAIMAYKKLGSTPSTLPPSRQIKLLPAATTSSSLVDKLIENNHSLIILETEADTLTTQINNPFGQFSDLLRKAFANETISKSTKIDQRLDYIYDPKLSVLLAGTPNQVNSLIKSTENGLFSRFCFLNKPGYEKWKPALFKENPSSKKEEMAELINFIIKLHELLFEKDNFIQINFTDKQAELFNEEMAILHDSHINHRTDILASIKRLGMIHSRLSTILTVVRFHEEIISSNELLENSNYLIHLECTDSDFNVSFDIVKTLVNHALEVLNSYGTVKVKFKTIKETIFYEQLPEEFRTEYAIENSNGYEKSGVDKVLKKWKEKGIIQTISHGLHKKLV